MDIIQATNLPGDAFLSLNIARKTFVRPKIRERTKESS